MKKAEAYLEEANKKKDEYVKKTLALFKNNQITKEELFEKIGTEVFTTWKLRLAISGK